MFTYLQVNVAQFQFKKGSNVLGSLEEIFPSGVICERCVNWIRTILGVKDSSQSVIFGGLWHVHLLMSKATMRVTFTFNRVLYIFNFSFLAITLDRRDIF